MSTLETGPLLADDEIGPNIYDDLISVFESYDEMDQQPTPKQRRVNIL